MENKAELERMIRSLVMEIAGQPTVTPPSS